MNEKNVKKEIPTRDVGEIEPWKIIDLYFQENPHHLVKHHVDSYNDFITRNIYRVFQELQPIVITVGEIKVPIQVLHRSTGGSSSTSTPTHTCKLYLGGKDGNKLSVSKPTILSNETNEYRYLFPNEARLRNMTYGINIYYDIECEFTDILVIPISKKEDEEYIYSQFNYINDVFFQLLEENKIKLVSPNIEYHERKDDRVEDTDSFLHVIDPEDGRLKSIHGSPSDIEELKRSVTFTIQAFDSTTCLLVQTNIHTFSNIYLGQFPIMLQSEMCALHGMSPELRYSLGECKNDQGGYFILQGKEKLICLHETYAPNMLFLTKNDESTNLSIQPHEDTYTDTDSESEDENEDEKKSILISYSTTAEMKSCNLNTISKSNDPICIGMV